MKTFALAAMAVLLTGLAPAQGEAPSPEEFLGYAPGRHFTPHHLIINYVEELARRSDRVRISPYGRTPGRRPLIYTVVTSAENHARMGALRERLGRLADPRGDDGALREDETIGDLPVVVWLSYNVHGNEPSPSETALVLLHRLATANDEQTTRWLDEAIIIIDPCLNPDGRERYVSWFQDRVGLVPDAEPQSLEHLEPWPGGRSNHYLFDLNRDWAFATQDETRARLPEIAAWTPQVHVDFHEMGYESDYFFFPAADPINANLPAHTLKWGEVFGRGNAEAFDARGWSYYTAESFDLFYPGYGDTWPSFTGAIGMTYEQGGHSRGGTAVRRESGEVLTLLQRLTHHLVASEATIDTAVQNRTELLGSYRAFRREAVTIGRDGPIKAMILPVGADGERVRSLVRTLLVQGIEVHRLERAATLRRVKDALGDTEFVRTFEAGSYVVRFDQPMMRLAKTLLEPKAELREIRFYDISAWSLPFAHGVPAFESPELPEVPMARVTSAPPEAGSVAAGEARVGWLLPWTSRAAMHAAAAALSEGIKLRAAHEPFTLAGQRYERGTLLVRRHEHGADIGERLAAIAKKTGATFIPARSGFTEDGIDLGSNRMRRVIQPRIALLGGEGMGTGSFGTTRWVLEREFPLPHSCLPVSNLAGLDLDKFTAVVVPEGRVSRAGHEKLAAFAREGGVVLAFGRSAFAMLGGKDAVLPVRVAPRPKDEPAADDTPVFTKEREDRRQKANQPGSIFRLALDPAHPLGFGYRGDAAAFQGGTRSFDPRGPGTHVALFQKDPALSGYVNAVNEKRLEGNAWATVVPVGRGAVVLFADDPNFRGVWKGTARIFLNALLFLPRRQP